MAGLLVELVGLVILLIAGTQGTLAQEFQMLLLILLMLDFIPHLKVIITPKWVNFLMSISLVESAWKYVVWIPNVLTVILLLYKSLMPVLVSVILNGVAVITVIVPN
jgi:hypothetical protein